MFTDFNSGALNMPTAYLVTNLTLTKSVAPTTHSLVYIGKGVLLGYAQKQDEDSIFCFISHPVRNSLSVFYIKIPMKAIFVSIVVDME